MNDLLLGAIASALAAICLLYAALSRRSVPAADGVHGQFLDRKDEEPASGSREHTPLLDSTVWNSAVVPDLATAEELLDQAEQDGYQERELIVLGESSFLVRWRKPADCENP